MSDRTGLISFYRVEGVTRPEPGRFGHYFCHVTLARTAAEAKAKILFKVPPFSQVTSVVAVNG